VDKLGDPEQVGAARNSKPADLLEELFERYERRIYNLFLRLVGNEEDAADLTSETFVRALAAGSGFRGEAAPYTWLYRIAANLAKNHFRQKHVRSRVTSTDEELTGASPVSHPQKHLEAAELQTQVARALLQLDEEARMLVVLRDLHGLSYEEVGRAMDIPADIVKSRLFRARRSLRELLRPYLAAEA
jgi:RNA polymerase sigma-70 factor (ECF subfamily)